jgi:hypothetical protein
MKSQKPVSLQTFYLFSIIFKTLLDLMLRKPRNARTDRLTDWRFFIQIYLVRRALSFIFYCGHTVNIKIIVHGIDDVALRHEHVVPLHVAARLTVL